MTLMAPLRLLSSMATRELLGELALAYERDTGRCVTAESAGGVDVAKRIENGEPADVVVLAKGAIDKLMTAGHLRDASRVDLVTSGIAVAVASGSGHPAIATEEDVKRAVLSARTLSYSTGPSGVYLEGLFERWGVLGALRAHIVVPPPGVAVGSLVADGRAELGFQQLSELLNVHGVEVVGPLPDRIQSVTTFSGAIGNRCMVPDAARDLLAHLAAPAAAPLKRRYGMEPA